jgi:hypothetical protein
MRRSLEQRILDEQKIDEERTEYNGQRPPQGSRGMMRSIRMRSISDRSRVYGIVQRHGGRIEVSSVQGQGRVSVTPGSFCQVGPVNACDV